MQRLGNSLVAATVVAWLASGCPRTTPPTDASTTSPATASRVARVDLARVRTELAVGADDIDAELTIALVAIAVAQAQGFTALVDESTRVVLGEATGSQAAVDLTPAVLATLGLPPLASMAWLVGEWRGTADGVETTELWCPDVDGRLLGDDRTIEGGREVAFEWLTIAADGSAPVFLAQPGGRSPPTRFAATPAATPAAAVFEDPTHDFPRRLEYGRSGAELHVVASGDAPTLRWTWTRTGIDATALAAKCATLRGRKQG